MDAWVLWLIAAAVLAALEMASLSFVLVMIAGGATAAALTAALGGPVLVQAIVFAIVSVTLLALVRPIAMRHMSSESGHHPTNVAALIGKPATVVEPIDADHGAVKIGGEVWTARPYDGVQALEAGEKVQVIEIQGATALVWRQQ